MLPSEHVNLFRKVHGDRYEYPEQVYDCRGQMQAICPLHGVFTIWYVSHRAGSKCQKCSNCYRMTRDEFISKATQKYDGYYDYSLLPEKFGWTSLQKKVPVICPKHGQFQVCPGKHLKLNIKCPKCKIVTQEIFERKARKIHGDRYQYGSYRRMQTKMEIICPLHGSFFQKPMAHIGLTQGCPQCHTASRPQKELHEWLESLEYKTIFDDRTVIKPYELDIWLPDFRVGIEVQGVYWHSTQFKKKWDHYRKYKLAEKVGISYVEILDSDWIKRKGATQKLILKILRDEYRPESNEVTVDNSSGCSAILQKMGYKPVKRISPIKIAVSASRGTKQFQLWTSGQTVWSNKT